MYYPKSQIRTNLYTNGGEFITPNGEDYTGFYYETSNGEKYTGKAPNNPPNLPLIQPQSLDQNIPEVTQNRFIEFDLQGGKDGNTSTTLDPNYYNSFLDFSSSIKRSLPTPIQTLPAQQDKDLGVFLRYFCKKNNENIYVEIDKEQFTKLQSKDKTIAWDLYTPKQVLWQIKGDKTQTYNANKNNVSLIEQRDKWYGFTQYFKDRFLKYYLES
jgi:hypothetical protein